MNFIFPNQIKSLIYSFLNNNNNDNNNIYYLSFYLKKNRWLNPNHAEVIKVFPEAIRNFTIFKFPAKIDQMIKRKYHYIYHFVAYLTLILSIYIFYRLGLVF
jgi:hypothetical protein